MSDLTLAPRISTVLWQGDVVVLGATWAGLAAAKACAARGWRTCLLEQAPVLGLETGACWRSDLPAGDCFSRARELAAGKGMPEGGPADVVLTTIAFDQVMAEAGVASFVRVMPTRAVAAGDGRLGGVEVVGKSGRQLVKASLVIDATPQRAFAQALAGKTCPPIGQVQRRIYVAGLCVPADGQTWSLPAAIGAANDQVRATAAAWPNEAILTFAMDTSVADGMARVLSRSMTVANDAFAWLKANVSDFAEANLVDVAPAVAHALEIPELPALAGTGAMVAPGEPSAVAAWIADLSLTAKDALPQEILPSSTPVDTWELLSASEQDLPSCELPVAVACRHELRDVVVAGYGTGGLFAALAAAEEGLSAAVVDPAPVPGGIGSAGRIHSYYHGLKGGMQDRLDEGITGRGGTSGKVRGYHPVGRAEVMSRAMQNRSGLDVHAGHFVFGVVREDDRIVAVLTAAQDGYHVFPCHIAIDGTGDGDLAAAAGAPMTLGRDGDAFPQPYSYTPTMVRDGSLLHHNFDAGWVDPTDTIDFSRAHFEGRARIWHCRQHSVENHYCTLASIIGIRESRFVLGPLTLTFDDFMQGQTYPDTVCSCFAHHDNHAMDYAEESEWSRRHVVMFGLWRYLLHGDLPYRALLPVDVEGLLVACRALSVDHDLHQLVRMQRDIQVIGEICGVAAALSLRNGTTPRDVDIAELRTALERRGIVPKATEPVMDLANEELLELLSDDGKSGLAMWRLGLRTGDDAPDWDAFVTGEQDADRRFRGAVAAAEARVGTPAVVAELQRCAEAKEVGAPLGIKSPARCIVAALALVDLGVPGTAKLMGAILLSDVPNATDALLLLKGLATTGEPAAIEAVKQFLSATDGDAFMMSLWGVSDGLPSSFRYAIDMRAVRTLIALGCTDEVARLEQYVDHPELLVRRHARRVRTEGDPLLA
ncbi:MAG: FAD-dependent oxidoreductase [Victivallales bacterium]|nr:FAD-dependent oxidoreductase [Victivallales bacterium]